MTAATHKGSCHCGKVRFTAGLDLAKGSVRCNCSICAKKRTWLAMTEPDSLRIETGEDALTTYTFGLERIQHRFCTTCGVQTFADVPGKGAVVNLATLDDLGPDDRAEIAIRYIDGAADRFDRVPEITTYL